MSVNLYFTQPMVTKVVLNILSADPSQR